MNAIPFSLFALLGLVVFVALVHENYLKWRAK